MLGGWIHSKVTKIPRWDQEVRSHPPALPALASRTFWVQAPHVLGFQGVVGADLDLELQDGVWEALEEELVDGHVEGGDHFLSTAETAHRKLSF